MSQSAEIVDGLKSGATRWSRVRRGVLPEPRMAYVGPVAIWFIPKPRGPRISLRRGAGLWVFLAPVIAATLLWVRAETGTLWPFGRRVTHISEVLLRYQLIGLVCLGYLTAVSLPVWYRHRRAARRDARDLDSAVRQRQWERAALLLHRYCLLVSAVWRKLPAQVAAWDAVVSERLSRHRRMYVYCLDDPPEVPQDPTAGFAITVLRPPRPSAWSALGLIPVAGLLYLLVGDVLRRGQLQEAFLFNTVLLGVLFISYATYFFTALLGRSNFLRFAPRVMQVVRYRIVRRQPRIETHDLGRLDLVLDLSSLWPGLTLLNTGRYKREGYRLPRGREAVEAVFRAALSTAPSPPLPDDLLVD